MFTAKLSLKLDCLSIGAIIKIKRKFKKKRSELSIAFIQSFNRSFSAIAEQDIFLKS